VYTPSCKIRTAMCDRPYTESVREPPLISRPWCTGSTATNPPKGHPRPGETIRAIQRSRLPTRLAPACVNAEADAQTRSFSAMLPFLPPVGRPADAPGGAVGSCCGCGCATASSTTKATARSPASDAWVGAVVAPQPPRRTTSRPGLPGATWFDSHQHQCGAPATAPPPQGGPAACLLAG
jgi:hypothetical protein